ncbi:MAG: ATP-binding protein [bacterium]
MSELKTILKTCKPRPDVELGTTKDEQFAADLAQVVNHTAPPEYCDPAIFFQYSYPTKGLKELLKSVCKRISGRGGEVASIMRLHTQYGGGKTHGLIALVHAVRGMQGVPNVTEFIDPELISTTAVRVAALDGENSDPANGLRLEGNLRAYSLWGELAYRLAGVKGYERVKESDLKHISPGAETIRELFEGQPALILLDEISVYLRKVNAKDPNAANQITPFLHALFKAVESSPQATLVLTLAVGKDDKAASAYKDEHEKVMTALDEAEEVIGRKALLLNPTEEDETSNVLCRRLFESVDRNAADEVIDAYIKAWNLNRANISEIALAPEIREQFRRGYPLHPETLELLTKKTSSLSNFQRIRGMIRLLARTVHVIWRDKPADVYAIHPHHIDPSFGPIRDELTVRLAQHEFAAALKADAAAMPNDEPSVAQSLDQKYYPGQVPITSYIARTIFLNSLAFGDSARGINQDRLNFSISSPILEPSFIEQARVRFLQEAFYLDDRPGAAMRFMVEPNLNQLIRKHMENVDSNEVRDLLRECVRNVLGGKNTPFNVFFFPAGPYEVPDEVGDGRPVLIVPWYEALKVTSEATVPSEIIDIYRHKGTQQDFRDFRNNLIFLAADARKIENMKDRMRRRMALEKLLRPENNSQLAKHQNEVVRKEYDGSHLTTALAILHCYRHLYYPSHHSAPGCEELIAHSVIEVTQASDSPGEGQKHIQRVLRDQKKILDENDAPDAPAFVRDQTPLKIKGEISTLDLRNEFRRAPKLSILLSDVPLKNCIRQGIEQDVFIYREGNQVWGKGDPTPSIKIADDAFVHTLADAKQKKLWPRAEPLEIHLVVEPAQITAGESARLKVSVSGGVGPYTYSSNEPTLALAHTTQTALTAEVTPAESIIYLIEVSDSRGQKKEARAQLLVAKKDGDKPEPPKPPPPLPPKITNFKAEGPLAQALTELWEKIRKAKVPSIQQLTVHLFDPPVTWKVHQAMITRRDAKVQCQLEVSLQGEGIELFEVNFKGDIEKANPFKTFLDQQIRAAKDHQFEAVYYLNFSEGLAMEGAAPEELQDSLTKYGTSEAYVEAYAMPPREA